MQVRPCSRGSARPSPSSLCSRAGELRRCKKRAVRAAEGLNRKVVLGGSHDKISVLGHATQTRAGCHGGFYPRPT